SARDACLEFAGREHAPFEQSLFETGEPAAVVAVLQIGHGIESLERVPPRVDVAAEPEAGERRHAEDARLPALVEDRLGGFEPNRSEAVHAAHVVDAVHAFPLAQLVGLGEGTRASVRYLDDGRWVELAGGTHSLAQEEPERIGALRVDFFAESASQAARPGGGSVPSRSGAASHSAARWFTRPGTPPDSRYRRTKSVPSKKLLTSGAAEAAASAARTNSAVSPKSMPVRSQIGSASGSNDLCRSPGRAASTSQRRPPSAASASPASPPAVSAPTTSAPRIS